MQLIQTGYLGQVGPVFFTPINGSVLLVQASFREQDGKMEFRTKTPGYADFLKQTDYFPFRSVECTLGDYMDNELLDVLVPNYKRPTFGSNSFEDYRKIEPDWVVVTVQQPTTTNPTTTNPPPTTNPSQGGSNPGQGSSNPTSNNPVTTGNNGNTTTTNPVSKVLTANSRPLIIGAFILLALIIINQD